MRRAAAAALVAVAAAGQAAAGELLWPQDGAERRMLLAEEAVEFRAVGRLEVGGGRFCTATLVSEREALTAAHCLFIPRSGAPAPLSGMRFVAGARNGTSAGPPRRVLRAAKPEGFALVQAPRPADLGDDIALVELDAPAAAEAAVTPFAVGPLFAGEAAPVIVSYARDRAEAPSINEACPAMGMVEGVLVVACAIERGVSGAPVLAGEGRGVRVVGVVSAMGLLPGGEDFALVAPAARWIDALRADLAAQAEAAP